MIYEIFENDQSISLGKIQIGIYGILKLLISLHLGTKFSEKATKGWEHCTTASTSQHFSLSGKNDLFPMGALMKGGSKNYVVIVKHFMGEKEFGKQ